LPVYVDHVHDECLLDVGEAVGNHDDRGYDKRSDEDGKKKEFVMFVFLQFDAGNDMKWQEDERPLDAIENNCRQCYCIFINAIVSIYVIDIDKDGEE
jgi:hypothetical protein